MNFLVGHRKLCFRCVLYGFGPSGAVAGTAPHHNFGIPHWNLIGNHVDRLLKLGDCVSGSFLQGSNFDLRIRFYGCDDTQPPPQFGIRFGRTGSG